MDKKEKADYYRQYYQQNKERQRERRRKAAVAYYHRHREERIAYGREYYAANKTTLREQQRGYETIERSQNLGRVREAKLASGCVDCGRSDDVMILDFDHVHGDKVASISDMVTKNYSWHAISAEIAKCVVRCKPCHRLRHAAKISVDW